MAIPDRTVALGSMKSTLTERFQQPSDLPYDVHTSTAWSFVTSINTRSGMQSVWRKDGSYSITMDNLFPENNPDGVMLLGEQFKLDAATDRCVMTMRCIADPYGNPSRDVESIFYVSEAMLISCVTSIPIIVDSAVRVNCIGDKSITSPYAAFISISNALDTHDLVGMPVLHREDIAEHLDTDCQQTLKSAEQTFKVRVSNIDWMKYIGPENN